MIYIEVVQLASRSVAPEIIRVRGYARRDQQVLETVNMRRGHFFFNAVRAQLADLATDVNAGLVNGIAEEITGIAANDQAAFLRHERTQVTNAARNDDIDAFHRYTAACAGVAFDDQRPAAP